MEGLGNLAGSNRVNVKTWKWEDKRKNTKVKSLLDCGKVDGVGEPAATVHTRKVLEPVGVIVEENLSKPHKQTINQIKMLRSRGNTRLKGWWMRRMRARDRWWKSFEPKKVTIGLYAFSPAFSVVKASLL